jgi:hypothetical protein
MKTGEKIVIAGAVGVIGYLAYLHFKSKKPDTASNDSSGGFIASLPPFIQSVLPSSESNSNTSSTTSGTSAIASDPLSTSEQKIADAILKANEDKALAELEASKKEAEEHLLRLAKEDELARAKVLSTGYSSILKKYNTETDSMKRSSLFSSLMKVKNDLKQLGYLPAGAGAVMAI